MNHYLFPIVLAAGLLVLYWIFCRWHSQGRARLTKPEIDRYMAIIEKLPLPLEETRAFCARVRPWAEADDGQPVYMLNNIRFFKELRTFSGTPGFKGTPQEANAHYEKAIAPLWLSHAAYPIFSGIPQTRNLVNIQPEREWGEVVICRYPNRRTFLKLLADPRYGPKTPYKFMAVELDLVAVAANQIIPDLRIVVGGSLLILFLAINWLRAVW
ncbi:MAG TPA: hypothetical protein VFQ83_03680 [Candidatus Udaeobacter sp.]|nr:hypothetical protein [Candidatus Udaeobacter sp.]